MRRGGGGGARTGVALEETGMMLGDLLRRALVDRLARVARGDSGAGPKGRRTDDGDAGGDAGRAGRFRPDREGEKQ